MSASSPGWRPAGSNARPAGMACWAAGGMPGAPDRGVADPVRPRRARCRSCLVTHVLLLVTVLVRRAYAAERIWAAFTARADGLGHRRIAATLGVPTATVRGWLRRAAERLEAIRSWYWTVAVTVGVDVRIPDRSGCVWRDAVVAVETATAPVGSRFGAVGLLGAVTPARVAVAASSARLLAPGWPPPRGWLAATRMAPDVGTG